MNAGSLPTLGVTLARLLRLWVPQFSRRSNGVLPESTQHLVGAQEILTPFLICFLFSTLPSLPDVATYLINIHETKFLTCEFAIRIMSLSSVINYRQCHSL